MPFDPDTEIVLRYVIWRGVVDVGTVEEQRLALEKLSRSVELKLRALDVQKANAA
jgi:hypothetical protein